MSDYDDVVHSMYGMDEDPDAKCEHGRPVGLCARCPLEDEAVAGSATPTKEDDDALS